MRMYAKRWGRFTSPDPQNAGADVGLPQSWNGYVYVLNNPLNLTDPSGLIWLRENGTDSYTWIDDDVYKNNKGDYKNYTPANDTVIRVTGGARATPEQIGQNVVLSGDGNAYTISDSDLALGTVYAPPPVVEMSPMHQLIAGSETVLWWGRPFVYALTAPVALAAAPVTAPAGGLTLLTLSTRAAVAAPTGLAALNQLINSVPRWEKLTSKTQGFVQGNAQQLFDDVAQGGTKLANNVVRLSDGRIVTLYNSSTNGVATIQVNEAGVKTVIRITQ